MIKYDVIIHWSDEDEAYIAEVPELPGCMADGHTYQEALATVEVISQEWIETARALGRSIPKPKGRLIDVFAEAREGELYRCPCCHHKTLETRGGYDICPVCSWEDDGQDDHDADIVRGGPNGVLSLTQAIINFDEFGACKKEYINHVRPPTPEEL
ncbi:MAG: type II toxin-antitoxin system HicB family antitoxin [Chloroflexi bacterium]|nr:type II toxin-antitoxin system HicB family antitoxin [Chloroflexota bacterium]MBI3733675.1 type II toxin-antitoxin system HicB family antitoxin [Chloroflexota bacterium]